MIRVEQTLANMAASARSCLSRSGVTARNNTTDLFVNVCYFHSSVITMIASIILKVIRVVVDSTSILYKYDYV